MFINITKYLNDLFLYSWLAFKSCTANILSDLLSAVVSLSESSLLLIGNHLSSEFIAGLTDSSSLSVDHDGEEQSGGGAEFGILQIESGSSVRISSSSSSTATGGSPNQRGRDKRGKGSGIWDSREDEDNSSKRETLNKVKGDRQQLSNVTIEGSLIVDENSILEIDGNVKYSKI